MNVVLRGLAVTAVSFACLAGAGSAHGEQRHTSIPFANLGNIRNWRSDRANELYVESQNRKWYRITFWSPCEQLPFAIRIAFVTDTLGSLDKFSSILVDGERCWFKSFEPMSGPPPQPPKG